jgi:chromate transporter
MAAKVKKVRYIIFLKDVFILAVTAFGGPQAHIAMLFERMVNKHSYLTEKELIELNALCQILPGPTSTQTIIAIGYRIGGPNLAYLTLLVWIIPAGSIMVSMGILMTYFDGADIDISFTRFIQPMAVGIIAFAAYKISMKVVNTKIGITLLVVSCLIAYFTATFFNDSLVSPIVFPFLLLGGGLVTSFKFRQHEKEHHEKMKIDWRNFVLFLGVFLIAVVIGNITTNRLVLLFENFYRNGSLIFGGGQVLIPMLKVEFVDLKNYLTNDQFLSGYGYVQAMPGPVFSFSGYVGAISMSEYSVPTQVFGGVISLLGIFLPGTFLIFFVIRFWGELKKYRVVKAALEGVNAVASGLVTAAVLLLYDSLRTNITTEPGLINIAIIIGTFLLLMTKKVPAPVIILAGLGAGFII